MTMPFEPFPVDARGAVINRMNDGRVRRGQPELTKRQEHLVREFTDDEGNILEQDILMNLLKSNSG